MSSIQSVNMQNMSKLHVLHIRGLYAKYVKYAQYIWSCHILRVNTCELLWTTLELWLKNDFCCCLVKSPGIQELLYSSSTEMKAQSNCLMQLSVWDSTEQKRRSLRYNTLSGLISNLPSSMQLWTINIFIICRICNICTICLIYIICREYVKYAKYAKYALNSKYVKYDKYIEICKILTFDYPAQSSSQECFFIAPQI